MLQNARLTAFTVSEVYIYVFFVLFGVIYRFGGIYLCILCVVWRDIAHHFFLFWSNWVNNEQGSKSRKPLATEYSAQSS